MTVVCVKKICLKCKARALSPSIQQYEGILPYPVRIPLLKYFENFYLVYCKSYQEIIKADDYTVRYDLGSVVK